MSERQPFEPLGDKSRRELVNQYLDGLPYPMEAGTVVTYEEIAEALGEEFPIPRAHGPDKQWLVPDYQPMGAVRVDRLCSDGVLLQPVPNVGYRVADDAQKLVEAEALWVQAADRLAKVSLILRSVKRDRLSGGERRMADDMAQEANDERKVLQMRQRHRRAQLRRWGEDHQAG